MSGLRFRYQTIEFDTLDIHLRSLKDHQQFEDKDNIAKDLGISSALWPLFGQLWPSSHVLAHLMQDYKVKNLRILEVGCGLGLSSLVLNERNMDITATDYHPCVEEFLNKNTELNESDSIPFERTSWEDKEDSLGVFDLIIGSDLLYESKSIELLSQFINNHAKPTAKVIIVDPGRGNHAKFSKAMVKLGFKHTQESPKDVTYLEAPFKGKILFYAR